MPFPTTDAEIEEMVRESLAAKVRTVAGAGHVFTTPFLISGKQQYVEKLMKENEADGDVEVNALFIEFAGFEDTLKGCDEAPHYKLVYALRAVREFVDERGDGSASANDFAAFVMNLRAKFLTERDLGYPERLYCEPLVQTDRAALEEDIYTGVFGHTAPFTLKVEVVPEG